jgi:hypothetical protein
VIDDGGGREGVFVGFGCRTCLRTHYSWDWIFNIHTLSCSGVGQHNAVSCWPAALRSHNHTPVTFATRSPPPARPCHGGYTGDHPHGRAVNLMRVESKAFRLFLWSRRAELLRCRHFTHPDMIQTPRPQSTHTPTRDSSETPNVRCTSRRAAPPRPDMA